MAKIFISYAREDSSVAQRLTSELNQRKHDVFLDQQSIRIGSHWQEDIKRHLKDADVFLALVTEHSDKSYYFNIEVTSAISYISHSNRDKLILPVVLNQASLNSSDLGAFQALFGSAEDFEFLVDEIASAISRFEGFRIAQEEIKAFQESKLEENTEDYIKETIEDLKSREKIGRKFASRWYFAGYAALIISVVFVFALWWVGGYSFVHVAPDTNRLLFDVVKGITIVALLLVITRYSFLLAKTYQLEAQKNADRLHAISFGKFYMRVFSKQITQSEVKEVFQHWNTAGSSDLSHLDVDKIDSRLFELFEKVADKIAGKTKP